MFIFGLARKHLVSTEHHCTQRCAYVYIFRVYWS